jgi:hypothetical protein
MREPATTTTAQSNPLQAEGSARELPHPPIRGGGTSCRRSMQ